MNQDGTTGLLICDGAGRPRGSWVVDRGGTTSLMLKDAEGRRCGEWATSRSGTHFALYDAEEQPRTILGSAKLYDAATGGESWTEISSIAFFDRKGKLKLQIP